MKSSVLCLAMSGALLTGGAARAVPGGDLDVLTRGTYACELPGDAGDLDTAAGRPVPGADFTVTEDSSYVGQGKRGVYLLTGDRMVMTSGRGAGRRFRVASPNLLQALQPDGGDAPMRCVRSAQAPARGKQPRCRAGAKPLASGGDIAQSTC